MKRMLLVLATLLGMTVLFACSDPTVSEVEAEIEDLEVTITNMSYDIETQVLLAEIERNISEGTEVDVVLYNPEFSYLTYEKLLI